MRVCVIGGSAAGMTAAYAAASNAEVLIVEANDKLGKKIYITGKGRCNFTNIAERDVFFANIASNPRFFYSAYSALDSSALIELFEAHGLKSKVERGGRVFPESDKSSDVIAVLKRMCAERHVEVALNERVLSVKKEDKFTVKTDRRDITCDKVIIATGGLAYPQTGSTGDGYALAKAFGHTLIPSVSALCPLILKTALGANNKPYPFLSLPSLQGLSLKNVRLSAVKGGKEVFSEFGEMLFTSDGISGPIVLSASSFINRLSVDSYVLSLDLKPALDEKTLDNRLLRDFEQFKNKNFQNSLGELLPKSLIPFIIKLSAIPPEKKVNEISKEERTALVNLLKNLRFTVKALAGFDNAIVTAGGVCVKEIDPKTMQSKLVSGLYFAGEVIDIDALTGGFNLQIAFSTGYLAGKSCVTEE